MWVVVRPVNLSKHICIIAGLHLMTQFGSGTEAEILKVLSNSVGKGLRVRWDAWVVVGRME